MLPAHREIEAVSVGIVGQSAPLRRARLDLIEAEQASGGCA